MAEFWQQVLMAEESARIQSRGNKTIPQRQNDTHMTAIAPQTYIFERDNYTSSLSMIEVVNIDGKSGVIEDVLVKAPSSDYTIDLTIDDHRVHFMHTWSELYEMSQDIESVVAVTRKGQYIAGMSNMYFTNKVTLNILATGITFKKIFAKVKYDG